MKRILLTATAILMLTTIHAQGAIDMHSHIITPFFVADLEAHDALLDEGFPIPHYDVSEHLQWMDEAGVQTSVLTLAAPQPFDATTVRRANEEAARLKRMQRYLTEEPDLAPFREMILHTNAEHLLGKTD